jgi:hypothetical protein
MIDEHFGMAVSELVVGGCVVLVPDSGGQTEIAADAVEKIVHVLQDETARAELRASLAAHAERFFTTRFQQQLGAIVARHASGAA